MDCRYITVSGVLIYECVAVYGTGDDSSGGDSPPPDQDTCGGGGGQNEPPQNLEIEDCFENLFDSFDGVGLTFGQVMGNGDTHKGLDLNTPFGTHLKTPFAGVIKSGGLGYRQDVPSGVHGDNPNIPPNFVHISRPLDDYTDKDGNLIVGEICSIQYDHLDENFLTVLVDQGVIPRLPSLMDGPVSVKKGTVIGISDTTGYIVNTGAHTHVTVQAVVIDSSGEISIAKVDPTDYFQISDCAE